VIVIVCSAKADYQLLFFMDDFGSIYFFMFSVFAPHIVIVIVCSAKADYQLLFFMDDLGSICLVLCLVYLPHTYFCMYAF
jgi:hypothetical protein